MADFEIIETGFSVADETINFGTRCIGIGSLYEISTVGCFKSDEDSSGVADVSINCLVNNGQIILSTDRSLKIFDDTKLSNLLFTAMFDANIASLTASPDNRFMLICLENGVVNVAHLKGSDGIVPIFTKCLSTTTSENPGYVEGFLEHFDAQMISFLVVYNSGAIFRLSIKCNNDSEEVFEVCPEEIFNLKSQITRASFVYPTLLTNGGECSILNTITKDVRSDVPNEIKKVFPLERFSKCVALDFQGNLWKICPLSLICSPLEYDALLDDIIVINDGKKCQIFAVTKPNETGEIFLQLLDTDFSQIFSLKISHPVHLINTNSTTDDLLFVSKVTKNDSITELRLQSVYETEPELRLTRLIRRRRFDEAEKFAKSFDIDPVVISKAKAQLIVEKSECTSQDIGNLMRLMDSICDAFFNLQCCSNVDCGRFEDVRKILTYAAKIPAKNDDASQDMKRLLSDLLFRFDTFMAISRNEDDIQSWYRFSTCNLIEELKVHLKNYEIEEAILIYSRMDQNALDELTEDCIEDILCILNNLPISVYQPFLPTFVPITVIHLPTSLPIFVKWLYAKIFLLEKRDKLNFPQSGITLAENVLKLLKVEKNSLFFQRQCTLNKKSIAELASLIEGLKILQQLKKQFRINVDLSDYLKGPETLIHTLLTSNMTPDDYENLLEQFLLNYMLQNNFDPDVIFLEEIKILLNYDQCWLSLIETLLKHVTSVRIKLEATKEILECSPVPWCEAIRKIASNAFQYSHPLVQVIETILKDEKRLIVMRNPKYRIKEKQINNHYELEYIIRKMMYVNEPTLVEDVYQLCQSTEDRCKASWFLIENFILKRKFDEALAVLNKNGKAEVYACTKWFVSSAIISINSKICPQERKDNYYNKSLFMLFERLSRSYQDPIEKRQFEEDFRNIRGVYNVNKYFNRSLTTYDSMSQTKKRRALDDLFEEIADNVREGPATIDSILTDADKLSLWFDVDKDRLLIDLCEKVGKFDVVLTVAEHLYETESTPRNLCSIAVLFLKYLGAQICPLPGESFDESLMTTTVCLDATRFVRDPGEGDVFLRGLRFARAVLAKAIRSAGREDFPFLEEAMCWVNSCFYLTRQESELQKKLFCDVYSPKQTTPSFAVVNTIRNWFHLYVGYVEKLRGPYRMHLSNLNSNVFQITQQQFQYELSSLPSIIDTFCREGQSLTAFKLVKTLISAFGMITPRETAVLDALRDVMLSKCVPYLLLGVVSADVIDVDLLYNLLLATQKSYLRHVHHFLKLYKRQPKKFRDIALVGIRLLDVHGESLGRDVMVNAAVTCKWWGRLERVRSRIQYDEFFKAEADARLRMLIALDVVDVATVRAYCEDFRLNLEYYYREFLKGCLVNWKPEYKITTNLDGKKSLVMLNDEDSLLSKCQEIINHLEDKNAVFAMMEKILKIANVYHYEVFICIYTILSNNVQNTTCRSTDINLLLFLKGYSRFSAPSQREREEWYTMFPDNQSLDALSEFRLPFSQLLFTSDIWSILRPEISLKSYRLWFEGTSMLRKNLKIDDVCVYAVKQVVSSRVLEENSSQEWILHPKFEELFQDVDECLENISDPEKAASVVYHLMNNTPNGADKVNAARLSYKYAFNYKEKNPDSFDVETAYNKVKNKYYRFSAMHILHKFNLADQKYLNLVAQPDTLIENLYMDPRIIKQVGSVNLGYPDISAAVDSLAELFRLDIMKMRRGLVDHWLSNTSDVGLDSTSLFPPQMSIQAKIVYDDDNLKRATYICGSGDVENWQTHLLKVGLFEDKNDEHKSLSFKAKALKCFCAITDEEKIAELTKITYQQFLDFVNKLTLLSELECLGISLTIETLDPYNKKELLKRLSQIGKPLAIKSMGSICMTYFLVENRYWDYIIKSSIKLGMIEELRVYVDYLKNKCQNSYYVKAWQVIIENSFQGITCPSDSALEEKLVENFLMIQSCPVLFNLQFEKIVQMCINMSRFEYAAVLLQYLPENQRALYVEEIMKSDTVLVDLENLDSKGIWGIQNIRIWLESKRTD